MCLKRKLTQLVQIKMPLSMATLDLVNTPESAVPVVVNTSLEHRVKCQKSRMGILIVQAQVW